MTERKADTCKKLENKLSHFYNLHFIIISFIINCFNCRKNVNPKFSSAVTNDLIITQPRSQ